MSNCDTEIGGYYNSRMEDIRKLWSMYMLDTEEYDYDLGNMYEYGLAFDYVAPGTFKDQREGYFRWQLSWGGPSDEFRFYANKAKRGWWRAYRIEYHYHNWFCGTHINMSGDDLGLLDEIFENFFDASADHVYEKATEY